MNKITFEDDRTLVRLLSKANVNHLEVFSKVDFGPKKSKMTQLFELMRDHEFDEQDELKSALYGKQVKADGNFRRMYHKFQDKLLSTLFFIDTKTPIFSERAKAYINCAKRIYVIRIMEDKGLFNYVTSLSEKTIVYSLKYEFTDLNISLARILCRQFSTTTTDYKKLKRYQQLLHINLELYLKEIELEKISYLISFESNSAKNRNALNTNQQTLFEEINKSIQVVHENPTIEMISLCSKISAYYFQKKGDLDTAKSYNNALIKKILAKKISSATTLEGIILNQLQLALITKDISECKMLEKVYFKKLNIGHFNWFAINYYYILNCFHSRFYKDGIETLILAFTNSSFKKQPSVILEAFYILEAYSHYLLKMMPLEILKINEDFKLNKFLNQVPSYSRDKQGINIPILFVQILFFLADKKFSKIIDRIESLNLYSYRHLKKDENFRSQCFIRMISEMVRADFRKQGTLFRTEKLLLKLKAVPIDAYPSTAETEIIPYEDLWEMVVERLD